MNRTFHTIAICEEKLSTTIANNAKYLSVHYHRLSTILQCPCWSCFKLFSRCAHTLSCSDWKVFGCGETSQGFNVIVGTTMRPKTLEQGQQTNQQTKGANSRSKDVTWAQKQRPDSRAAALTWQASKCNVHALHQRYILIRGYRF